MSLCAYEFLCVWAYVRMNICAYEYLCVWIFVRMVTFVNTHALSLSWSRPDELKNAVFADVLWAYCIRPIEHGLNIPCTTTQSNRNGLLTELTNPNWILWYNLLASTRQPISKSNLSPQSRSNFRKEIQGEGPNAEVQYSQHLSEWLTVIPEYGPYI